MKNLFFIFFICIFFSAQPLQLLYSQNKEKKAISFCKIFDSGKFDNKVITTTAILFSPEIEKSAVDGNSDEFFYSIECNNRDYFSKAIFFNKNDLQLIKKLSDETLINSQGKRYLVNFTGKFSLAFSPTFGHLDWLRSSFAVLNIISIKPVRSDYPFPNVMAYSKLLENSKSLKYINNELLFTFFNRSSNLSEIASIFSDQTKLIYNKKTNTLDELLIKLKDYEKGDLLVKEISIEKSKKLWMIKGQIEKKTTDGKSKYFQYQNNYVLKGRNIWSLIETKIWEIKSPASY